MLRKVLLACGVISSVVYVGADLVAAIVYPTYHSFTAQAISELTAINSPTRGLLKPMFFAYNLLVIAFAAGVWMSATHDRLRVAAAFIAAIGGAGLIAAPFADMNLRGTTMAVNDVLHIATTVVIVLSIFGAVMFASATLGDGFFRYSIVTLVILGIFGVLAGMQGPRLAAGETTPWFGVVERVHIGAYLLWVVVLSRMVWLHRRSA